MRFIFDRKDDIYKLGDIIEAFENKPKYEYSTIKPPPDNFRNMDGLFDKLVKTYNEEALIIVSSGYCRAHTGKSVMQWDKQPVVRGGQSIFITPSIAFLMRREADLMDFAKVISSAMYLKSTGGEGKAFAEEVKVRTKTDIDNCIIHVKETGVVAFDFETYVDDEKAQDYEWYRDDFHASLLSITPQPGISYTIPLKHFENPIPDSVREYILKQLNDGIFNNPDVRKIGWNVKFDMHVAKKIGMDLRGRYDDPMVMYSILDNTVTNRRLKQVAGEYFQDTIGYDTEVGAYRWKEVPLDILSKYAASDTSITILLAAVFEAQMDETLTRLYRNIVAPGTKVLFEAEHRGMDVDIEVLNEAIAYSEKLEEDITKELMSYPQVIRYDEARIQREIDKAIKQDKAKIHKWESEEGNKEYYIERAKERIRDIKTGVREVAKPLNLASVPMMKGLLYSKEGFGFKTKIKNTSEATLVDIKDDTGFIDKFLLRRKLAKNRS
ncbi:MAG TPA: hypothetical protein VK031_09875, partial [Tissierellaceae bacterium]|nr:hypothetical protein [Tissierellaceae bacterium]